jgi:hypothetical protein
MKEGSWSNLVSAQPWLSTVYLAATTLLAYHAYLRNYEPSLQYSRKSTIPSHVEWLDQETFDVFCALCDTVVPSCSAQQCNTKTVLAALDMLHPSLKSIDIGIPINDIDKLKSYLCAGALQYGTHKHCVEALHRVTSTAEKKQMFITLKVLSTSLGTMVMTGYPLPFHVSRRQIVFYGFADKSSLRCLSQKLSLTLRERVLQSFRDSCLEPKKQLFLVSYCY